jgi:outer membrane lipoprotein-sorting protein
MRQRMYVAIVACLVSSFAAVAFGETIESVEKKISQQVSKYKTLQVKSRQKTDMELPQMKMKQTSETTLEAARKGDTWASRQEIHDNTVQTSSEGAERKDEGTTLMIFDGKVAYTLVDRADTKMATKATPDPKQNVSPFDIAAGFEAQHQNYDSKLLADQDVDGKACYVIELTAKEPSPMGARMVVWYQKDCGLAVKMQSFNQAGKEIMTSTVTEIRIDKDIAPERFVFKAPAGVEVRDLDKERAQAETPQTAPAEQAPKTGQVQDKPKAEDKPKPAEKPAKKDPIKGALKGLLGK